MRTRLAIAATIAAATALLGAAPAHAATVPHPAATAATSHHPAGVQPNTTYVIQNYGSELNMRLKDDHCSNGNTFIGDANFGTAMGFSVNPDGTWSFWVPSCGTNPYMCMWVVAPSGTANNIVLDPCRAGNTEDTFNHYSDTFGRYWFPNRYWGCDPMSWNTPGLTLICNKWWGNNSLWAFR